MEVPSTKHILSNCLILSLISTIVIAQIPQRFTSQNPCTSKSKCHECIQTPSCAWCTDPEFKGSARCFQPAAGVISNKICREEFVLNPDTILSMIENLQLTTASSASGGGGGTMVGVVEGGYEHNESSSASGSTSGSSGGSSGSAGGAGGHGRIVQMAPQRLKLKLRVRETYSINMYYSQAEGYPVDLYYLMDLSKSMEDDKNKLYTLGDQLAYTMKKLTSNFRLGFGSFVDKVVMPYVNTLPEKLRNPCEQCVAPYGFHHHMTLSNNTHMFSHMVKQANVSGNLDAPEGGFDAIMQAIVCENQIGWRKNARRLLVFSTDASFHFAGDGKLGGIVKPNDGSCHLSHEGFYTQSSFQDYPSIEQINLNVKKNYINVIFAVTKSTISIYEQLARNVEGASVGKLEGDSSNIVELIKEQYQQISSIVEMKHNASDAVNLKFHSRCLNSTGALVATNKCENIKVGDLIHFKIDLEVIKCPKNRADHFQTIRIYPVGIDESLIIDLQMLCECDCEKPGHKFYEENSPYCSHHGTYKCGICECIPGAFGRRCECTSEEISRNVTMMDCIDPKNPTGPECSGKGQCVCGRCECETRNNDNERIYGPYCECDNFSCERHDGKLCSDHGTCDCGVCHCTDEWTGPNCACRKSKANCYPPGTDNNVTCSGHGVCECGQCVCDYVKEGRYTGKFCEKCPNCRDRCEEFKDCVQCQQYKTGPLNGPDCAANCTTFTPIPVKEVIADEEKGEVKCVVIDEEDCHFAYIYYYDDDNKFQIRVQEERECPEQVQLPAVILGVIAAVVLIGMAMLLLWKVFTTIHDKREFARFEKEKMMAKWDTTCSDRCEEFKDCVQCQLYKTGKLKDSDCLSNCTKFVPIAVEEVVADEENNEILCAYYDEDECRFTYVYYFDADNKIQVRAQQERECPSKVYVPGIVLGVIAAVVLIGMAVLLLWKLLTTIHDRREFARFEKEKMMAKWDTGENPIYKQATSTFKNPTYAGKC